MIFEGYISSKKQIANDTWEITISHTNDLFYFNAGQYVWIITNEGRMAFSICSSSKDPNNLKIIFRNRYKSPFKETLINFENNQKVMIRGPLGSLRVPVENRKTLYITAGVGVAPAVSVIESLIDSNIQREITLIFANSNNEDTFYTEKFIEFENLNNKFKFISVIGKVLPEQISKNISDNTDIYVLGSDNFVNGVFDILNNLKLNTNNIFFEEKFPKSVEFNVDLNDKSLFKKVVDQSANHVVITDSNGIIMYANKSAERLTGFTFEEMKGQTPRLWGGEMDAEVYKKLWNTIKNEKKPFRSELTNVKKSGEKYEVIGTISPFLDDDGTLLGFMGIEEDITQNKKDKEELEKISKLFIENMSTK